MTTSAVLAAANATDTCASMAPRGSHDQHEVGAVPCTCGHRRAGHRSYYFLTDSTACIEIGPDRCPCRRFVAEESR